MSRSIRLRADLARTFGRRLAGAWRAAARTARLAIGIPDYDAYLAHVRERHPSRPPMDREAFFRDRMLARYGRRGTRCC